MIEKIEIFFLKVDILFKNRYFEYGSSVTEFLESVVFGCEINIAAKIECLKKLNFFFKNRYFFAFIYILNRFFVIDFVENLLFWSEVNADAKIDFCF